MGIDNEIMVKDNIEDIIGYPFKNKRLLEQALTTTAYSNENCCNDQSELQTIGDAVIKLVLTELAMIEKGNTTRHLITVCRINQEDKTGLAKVARDLKIEPFIKLGIGQKKQNHGNSDHVLAETLEAVAGAIYIDGGFDKTKDIMKKWFED
ncbi:ribonuclease III [Methanosalsum zhilinae DSM 4017]|uniref:Ribonuclease III n=1 Tax=Methanosalsum zhilinae (strain DSM 4017 / NBRC 107636 / OCM 62 / WeN5) TaxID=679901 RepID=F7XKJ6_METZD|nr:ribonuclease III domain-containing protein [Methanosalsum zhilinae]AEH60599.1 ribonuclease III [Methanosalsum zhilinae DSM 4017]